MARLIVLGSGTGAPSLRRSSPGLALVSGKSTALIDSGSGTLRRMIEAGITYRDMDLLLYTHIHPDHICDLVPILFACRYGDLPREKDLICAGGPGFKGYFTELNAFYGPWIEPLSYRLTIEEITESPFLFRDLVLSSKPMSHLPGSAGYRIELGDGKAFAVSGDTDYCENLVELGREADLLVVESSFPDGKKVDGHLTPSLAGRIGTASGCKRLLLTHLYPICDQYDILEQCKAAFAGDVTVAEDLMRIDI
jgi:ribonuclease BN (tRNA processing enzyme)